MVDEGVGYGRRCGGRWEVGEKGWEVREKGEGGGREESENVRRKFGR